MKIRVIHKFQKQFVVFVLIAINQLIPNNKFQNYTQESHDKKRELFHINALDKNKDKLCK